MAGCWRTGYFRFAQVALSIPHSLAVAVLVRPAYSRCYCSIRSGIFGYRGPGLASHGSTWRPNAVHERARRCATVAQHVGHASQLALSVGLYVVRCAPSVRQQFETEGIAGKRPDRVRRSAGPGRRGAAWKDRAVARRLDRPVRGPDRHGLLFGAESVVLLDMVASIDRRTPVVFLETGKLFPETLAYKDELVARLRLEDVRSIGPTRPTWRGWIAKAICGAASQTGLPHPQDRALASGAFRLHRLDHRPQAVPWRERTGLPTIESDPVTGQLKLNPLATWSLDDIRHYRRVRQLPFTRWWRRAIPRSAASRVRARSWRARRYAPADGGSSTRASAASTAKASEWSFACRCRRRRSPSQSRSGGAVRLAWGKAVWQVAEHEDNA